EAEAPIAELRRLEAISFAELLLDQELAHPVDERTVRRAPRAREAASAVRRRVGRVLDQLRLLEPEAARAARVPANERERALDAPGRPRRPVLGHVEEREEHERRQRLAGLEHGILPAPPTAVGSLPAPEPGAGSRERRAGFAVDRTLDRRRRPGSRGQ